MDKQTYLKCSVCDMMFFDNGRQNCPACDIAIDETFKSFSEVSSEDDRILCDCCNKRISFDESYATPGANIGKDISGIAGLNAWLDALPGRVSRIVCKKDYNDYIKIVSGFKPGVLEKDFLEILYLSAQARAKKYLRNEKTSLETIMPDRSQKSESGCMVLFFALGVFLALGLWCC